MLCDCSHLLRQVVSLNGTPVRNLRHLVSLVENCSSPYLDFFLEYNQRVVLANSRAKAATAEILSVHCIGSDRSPDLLAAGAAGGSGDAAAAAAVAAGTAAAGDASGSKQPTGGRQRKR